MISKEKTIEILEKALANPRYLTVEGTNHFCSSVLTVVLSIENITYNEADEMATHIQETYIYPSINESLFLKAHLGNIGVIPRETKYRDEVYKVAARKHWRELIDSIKQS